MKIQRILFLVPELDGPPGGILRYSRLVVRALQDTGAEVTAVTLRSGREQDCFHDCGPSRIVQRSCNNSRAQFAWTATREAAKGQQLILAAHPYFAPLAYLLSRATGSKSMVFMHGFEVWERLSPPRRLALGQIDRLVAVSALTAQRASMANGFDVDRVDILPGCLDPGFATCLRNRRKADNLSLLTVSRLKETEPGKGHAVTLQSLPVVLARFPNCTLTIAGDGDGRRPLEQLTKNLGIGHAVSFVGNVSHAELRRLYENASVFVLPSQNEGFGLVFVEAMAHGMPVIAGNLDATPEVVCDGVTGLLVDPRNPQAVSSAIIALLGDPTRAAEMGSAGVRLVRERFMFDEFRCRLWKILDRLHASATLP